MTDLLLAGYEAVPYESRPISPTDPDAIAAIAILHGVTPPPADSCRVLELGCATAGNLLSMAFRLPKSRFVGVDLGPTQIAAGRLAVSEMGLQNVSLEVRSIDAIDESIGTFDYIICHGVYSWVPPRIQDEILRVCSKHLAPSGVAYVSYNTLPGGYRRGILRDMLLFHDDPSLSPAARVSRAREFAVRLAAGIASDQTAHAEVIREELGLLAKQTDHHLFHEQLEPFNEPVHVTEFVRRASAKGLRYLAEATLGANLPAARRAAEAIIGDGDVVRTEQYIDFVAGHGFRRTLLCHAGVEVSPKPQADAVRRLFARSRVVSVPPAEADAARGPDVKAFRTPSRNTITTNQPLLIAVLTALASRAPAVVSFDDVQALVRDRLVDADETTRLAGDDPDVLVATLLECASMSLVEFRSLPSRFVAAAGNRPKASGLARWQSLYFDHVAAMGHWPVEISGVERFILPLLDGSHDRAQLVRLIERGFQSGDLEHAGGSPSREQIAVVLDDVLGRLGHSAVLVA